MSITVQFESLEKGGQTFPISSQGGGKLNILQFMFLALSEGGKTKRGHNSTPLRPFSIKLDRVCTNAVAPLMAAIEFGVSKLVRKLPSWTFSTSSNQSFFI